MASQDEPPAKNGTSPPSPSVHRSCSTSESIQSNLTNQLSHNNNLALPQSTPSLSQAPVAPSQDGSQHLFCSEMDTSGLAVIPPSGSDTPLAGSLSSSLEKERIASMANGIDDMEDVPLQDVHLQPQHPDSQPGTQSQESLVADSSLSEGQLPNSNGITTGAPALPSWNPAALLNPKGKGTPLPRSSSPGSGPAFGHSPQPSPQVFQFSSASDNDNGNNFANESNGDYRDPMQYALHGHASTPEPQTNGLSRPYTSTLAYSQPQPQQMASGRPILTSTGMGSMIERMSGVQDRSTVPTAKRQKISDGGNEDRPKYGSNSSSSGILSSYVKEKQLADQSMAGPQAARKTPVLDLTAGTFSILKSLEILLC